MFRDVYITAVQQVRNARRKTTNGFEFIYFPLFLKGIHILHGPIYVFLHHEPPKISFGFDGLVSVTSMSTIKVFQILQRRHAIV